MHAWIPEYFFLQLSVRRTDIIERCFLFTLPTISHFHFSCLGSLVSGQFWSEIPIERRSSIFKLFDSVCYEE